MSGVVSKARLLRVFLVTPNLMHGCAGLMNIVVLITKDNLVHWCGPQFLLLSSLTLEYAIHCNSDENDIVQWYYD